VNVKLLDLGPNEKKKLKLKFGQHVANPAASNLDAMKLLSVS
jgi:hypothetical protein